MDTADNRRGWQLRSGRHLYDATRLNAEGETDGWVATFAAEQDAEFVASLVASTADERQRATRQAAHAALWDARRAMYLAGVNPDSVAGQALTDAITALEPSPTR